MSWTVSAWVAAALLTLSGGQIAVLEGNWLSSSGYHVCTRNETRNVSFLVVHKVPYTVTKPCDGWTFWKTCTITVTRMVSTTEYRSVWQQVPRCCGGYEQAGHHCVLPVNRSGEFAAKAGSCPARGSLGGGSQDCGLDIECPGSQKCCRLHGRSACIDPANSTNYPENGGNRLNATVTVKTDYQQLMSESGGLLNHLRLLQSVVSGALQSDVVVYYLDSWPVQPYRTASSLLVLYSDSLSLHNVTLRLHLLLKHVAEVSSVTVRDVDECAHPPLRRCSLQALCNNTMGSYQCACHRGYVDVDPRNPGANCTAHVNESVPNGPLTTAHPPMNTTHSTAPVAPQEPTASSSPSSESSTTNTNSVQSNSSGVRTLTSPAPRTSMSSSGGPRQPTCPPPSISSLWTTNVTGTSFLVCWSSRLQTSQTYVVVVSKGSDTVFSMETNETMMEVRQQEPGALYNITVTPCTCGIPGASHQVLVKMDAQALDAKARLTNIPFTADLLNTSSLAHKNLSGDIKDKIKQSLPPDIKVMLDLDQVRIEITGFSQGSVVVNFKIISIPTQSHDITNVSDALLDALKNIPGYNVDKNNTSINDFDECASEDNDCSHLAICTNTWTSYTCACPDGWMDNNPERPGRTCQEIVTVESTTLSPRAQMTPHTSRPATNTATIFSGTIISIVPRDVSALTVIPTLTTNPATTVMTRTTSNNTSPTISTTGERTTITLTPTNDTVPNSSTTDQTTLHAFTIFTHPTITTTLPTTTNGPSPTVAAVAATTNKTATMANDNISNMTMLATITMIGSNLTLNANSSSMTTASAINNAPTATNSNDTVALTKTVHPTTRSVTNNTDPPTTLSHIVTTVPTAPPTSRTATINSTLRMTSVTSINTHTPLTAGTPMAPPTEARTTRTPSATSPGTSLTTGTSKTVTAMATTSTTPVHATPAVMNLQGDLSVQCRVAAITVSIAKDFLWNANIQESALYLGSVECGVNGGNDTHVQLTVAWNECNTELVQNETNYTASVTLFNYMDSYTSAGGEVKAPRIRLEMPIMCTYMKNMLISADFGSTGYDMIQEIITGLGSFQVKVQLMNGTVPLPQNYSLAPEEAVVVEVSLNTSSDQIKLVISSCWATATRNPVDVNSYTFLENSCSQNMFTKVLVNGNSSTSRVSIQIFSIVNLDVIYLHCQVQVCLEIGEDSCVPDCRQRTARSGKTVGRTFGSIGPIFKLEEGESQDDEMSILQIVGFSCLGVGLSLFFIIGFICLFFYQRNRIGHYNFSIKPKEENFTYLVFNT